MTTIILTGISGGLGKSIHNEIISRNFDANCIFISRKPGLKNRPRVRYLQLDLSDTDNLPSLPEILERDNYIIFINNAATIEPIDLAANVDLSKINESMSVNVFSPLKLVQDLVGQALSKKSHLFILNISSGAATHPVKGWMSYCLSKAAVKMAFEVFSAENSHVSVMHYDPGVIDTKMQETIRKQPKSKMPDIDLFYSYYSNGTLKSPTRVAEEIIRIIELKIQ